ncbi:MAG: aldehyde dehydrogenase family protein, partial [Ilumatobacter sp.]|nr:aldehyde dehydrogenase family protein [Ilumatobacter sp.]
MHLVQTLVASFSSMPMSFAPHRASLPSTRGPSLLRSMCARGGHWGGAPSLVIGLVSVFVVVILDLRCVLLTERADVAVADARSCRAAVFALDTRALLGASDDGAHALVVEVGACEVEPQRAELLLDLIGNCLDTMRWIPTGIVVAISPFNYPGLLVVHKIAPALAAGNAVILKPASQAPLTALIITEKLVEAGLPESGL